MYAVSLLLKAKLLAAIVSGITYFSSRGWLQPVYPTYPFRLVRQDPPFCNITWRVWRPSRSSNVKLIQQSYSNHTTPLWCLWVVYEVYDLSMSCNSSRSRPHRRRHHTYMKITKNAIIQKKSAEPVLMLDLLWYDSGLFKWAFHFLSYI